MPEGENHKRYDLEERTFLFAKRVPAWGRSFNRTALNIDDIRQLIRCSGSVAGNYIEAHDAPTTKDLRMRIKICRTESKESPHPLRLLECEPIETERER